jgi:hypothetical protein
VDPKKAREALAGAGFNDMKVSMNKRYGWAILALMAVTIAGCGGGGSTAAPTFPLRSALDVMTLKGSHFKMTAIGTGAPSTKATDGDCSGTLEETDAVAVASTAFNGQAGYFSDIKVVLSFSNCSRLSATVNETAYFDANLVPLATVDSSGKYGLYTTPPVIPATVTVTSGGGAVPIGTLNLQVSKTDATSVGHSDWSYVIEADSATSVIANSIQKNYDKYGNSTLDSQLRYRLDVSGKLTVVSQDMVIYEYSPATPVSLATPVSQTVVKFRCTSDCAAN